MKEIEKDGFITRAQDLKSSPKVDCSWGRPMESLDFAGEVVKGITAKPMRECIYPRCMECQDYVVHKGEKYCTVPMVISKQLFFDLSANIEQMNIALKELENALYDEILGVQGDIR